MPKSEWLRRGIWRALLGAAALVLGLTLEHTPERDVHPLIVWDPDTNKPGDYAPLYDSAQQPTSVLHFGLSPDRGLPLQTIANGDDQIIIGADPKVWRFTYLTAIGLVWSNYMPSWLPTNLYGGTWYPNNAATSGWWHIDDKRAYVWPAGGGNVPAQPDCSGQRYEFSNGLTDLECCQTDPSKPQVTCPEDPDVSVSWGSPYMNNPYYTLIVQSADGTKELYQSETPWDPVNGARYANRYVFRADEASQWNMVREFVRHPVDDNNVTQSARDPQYKITKIWSYTKQPSGQPLAEMTRWIWRDENSPSSDCAFDPTTQGQCNDTGGACYDRRCQTNNRQDDQVGNCYYTMCSGLSIFMTKAQFATQCLAVLCNPGTNPPYAGAPDAATCFNTQAPCDQAPPPDINSDPKLQYIVMPKPVSPGSTVPLIYNLLYDGDGPPGSKFLTRIVDNQGGSSRRGWYNPDAFMFGNAIQFGYDNGYQGIRTLKSVSHEHGTDRQTVNFQVSNFGLVRRVWTDRQNPYHFEYADGGDNGVSPSTVTMTDPFGVPTVFTLKPIGDHNPANGTCDPSVGCNVQMGLTSVALPDGGTIANTYTPDGRLQTTTDEDGTLTTFVRDASNYGRVTSATTDCVTHAYQYGNPDFPLSPTQEDVTINGMKVSTQAVDICSPNGGTKCPPYEYGKALKVDTTLYNTGGKVTVSNSFPGAGKKTTTIGDNKAPAVTIGALSGRDSTFGYPGSSASPGTVLAVAGTTPDFSATPSMPNPNNPDAPTDPTTCSMMSGNNQNCQGSQATQNKTGTLTWQYAPDGSDANLKAALTAMNVNVPTSATLASTGTSNSTTVSGNSVTTTGSTSDGTVATAVTDSYGGTGSYIGTIQSHKSVINGQEVDDTYTWGQQRFTYITGAMGSNNSSPRWGHQDDPGALAQFVHTAKVNGQDQIVYGTYANYAVDGNGYVVDTQFGPLERGHVDVKGMHVKDWEVVSDPRRAQLLTLGCPFQPAASYPAIPCATTLDCTACGEICDNGDDGSLYPDGTCTPLGGQTDTLCHWQFTGDDNSLQTYNLLAYRTIDDSDFFHQQCGDGWCSNNLSCPSSLQDPP